MPENPKSRSPRIEIRPDLWPALQVEAIARGLSPKELVNSLILAALSPRAHEFMSPCTHDPMIPSSHDTITPETIATKPPITPAALDGLWEGASPGQEVGKRTFPGRMNQITKR